jgi:Ulp1 family protease
MLIDPARGVSEVAKHLRKYNGIEKYRYITIPVNMKSHWSLLVVTNIGMVNEKRTTDDECHDNNDEIPLLLHLDSLKNTHDTKYLSSQVYGLINYVWIERGMSSDMNLFNEKSLPFLRLNGKFSLIMV